MNDVPHFSLEVEQVDAYEFRVRFDMPDAPDLLLDEPRPLGGSHGPNAARLVAAAVAHCLSSSLVFCMGKFHEAPGRLRTKVTGEMKRNERGRLRIGRYDVAIHLPCAVDAIPHLDRCTLQFEDFCMVTESLRQGVDIGVQIVDGAGQAVWVDGAVRRKGAQPQAAA